MTILFCPGCGGQGALRFRSNFDLSKITETSFSSRKVPELMHHDLHECANCKTLFVQFVAASELLRAYESAPLHATEESFAAASTYRKLIAREISTHPLSVLDIGCGDGAFLSQMIDSGTEIAHGVEPSMDEVNQSIDSRVTILAKTLNDLPSNYLYDAVCLFQTIEHLRLFTQHGIRRLLEASGLQIRTLRRFSNNYPLTYALRLAFPKLIISEWFANINVPIPAGNLFIRATRSPNT
jgi:hypothetical protein